MNSAINNSPNIALLVILLGGGFLAGLIFRFRIGRPATATPAAQSSGWWLVLAIPAGLFSLLGLGYLVLAPHGSVIRYSMQMNKSGSDSSFSTTTITSSSDNKEMPVVTESTASPPLGSTSSHQSAEPVEFLVGLKFLVVALFVGGILALAWPRRGAAVAVNQPVTTRAGYSWLIVPALCLTGLGMLAGPLLLPPAYSTLNHVPAIFPDIQARMDKAVRELVEDSAKPGAEIQNVPHWIKNRTLTRNQHLLSSGQYTTQQEAEEELVPIAADLFQRAFHERHPWQGNWKVPLTQVRERVMDQRFVEVHNKEIGKNTYKFYRLHVLVNVSPEVCETFTESWKAQIVERRLKVFGVLLAWLSGVFLLGNAYFRSLNRPGMAPYYWSSTLKASIMTMLLTGAAGWVLGNYVH